LAAAVSSSGSAVGSWANDADLVRDVTHGVGVGQIDTISDPAKPGIDVKPFCGAAG
jgi:hypothetical protein